MVSTRGGIKLKFYEGERVLCYEPDPTKAKVLYDSKVLDVVITKDHRGRKNVEYLIHFQGWNSSWDRCVREEYVLKDTPENRQLQKDLAEKSQLHIGAYLYRKERKKHNRKNTEPIAQSSEDGSLGSPAQLDTEESSHSSDDDDESSLDDEAIPIELTQDLRNILEHDYHNINNRNKLMKLPADPNVVTILEMYWKHYATGLFCGLSDKPHTRHRTPTKVRSDDVQKNLNICKEMLDGLRIYFDFTINDLLLYKKEQNQVETTVAKSLSDPIKQEVIKPEIEDLEYAHLPNTNVDAEHDIYNHIENNHFTNNGQRNPKRRRGLRSARNAEARTNGIIHETPARVKPNSSTSQKNSDTSSTSTTKFLSWKLLPDYVYHQQPLPPSLVYGATHLLRLFVKLPELLNVCTMTENKLKVLQRHLDLLIDFLNHHKEWYGDKFYLE